MTDIIDTKTNDEGTKRYALTLDTYPTMPDGDYFGDIYGMDRGHLVHQSDGYKPADFDYRDLNRAWSHFGDWDLVARYARMFFDVAAVHTVDTLHATTLIEVVSTAAATEWGNANANLTEWEAWAEGDVYMIVPEVLVTWTSDHGATVQTWEQDPEEFVLGGLYGSKWADETLAEMTF